MATVHQILFASVLFPVIMISEFSDHASNERTFLAWLRTAVAMMAFGFLIEKFEVSAIFGHPKSASLGNFMGLTYIELIGLAMFVSGICMIILSGWRFLSNRKKIDSADVYPYALKRENVVLSVILAFITVFLLALVVHRMLSI